MDYPEKEVLFLKRIVALLLVCILCCCALAACGEDNKAANSANGGNADGTLAPIATDAAVSSPADSETDPPAADPTDAPDNGGSSTGLIDGKYPSISAYLESSEWTSMYKSIQEALGDFMILNCYAEGDMLVYDYQYTDTYTDTMLETMQNSLKNSLDSDSSAASFINVASTISKYCVVTNPSVKVIYRNGDGSILAEKTYYPD